MSYSPINRAPTRQIGGSAVLRKAELQASIESSVTIIQPTACDSEDSCVFTVSIGLQGGRFPVGSPPDTQLCDVFAEIKWGNGGARFSAVVDVRIGTMVTVLGSQLQVSAGYNVINDNSIDEVIVNAALAHGSRPGSHYVTRTLPEIEVPANSGAVDVLVPNFAYAFQAFSRTANFAASTRAQVFGNFPPPNGSGRLLHRFTGADLAGAYFFDGLKIPGNSRVIRFINDDLEGPVFLIPMFVLSL